MTFRYYTKSTSCVSVCAERTWSTDWQLTKKNKATKERREGKEGKYRIKSRLCQTARKKVSEKQECQVLFKVACDCYRFPKMSVGKWEPFYWQLSSDRRMQSERFQRKERKRWRIAHEKKKLFINKYNGEWRKSHNGKIKETCFVFVFFCQVNTRLMVFYLSAVAFIHPASFRRSLHSLRSINKVTRQRTHTHAHKHTERQRGTRKRERYI